jgi:prophage antirepressor-like protein
MNDSSELSFPFDDGNIVRFVGSLDVPEWVAADIVSILYPNSEASDRTNLLKGVPSDWKGMKPVHTLGGVQNMVTLFEPGLYSLIARSNSPVAVRFQKWVFEEVLPSIRQTGSYSIERSGSSVVVLPPAREKLENIRLGMDLLYELGGIDERTQLALRDIVRDVLLEDKLKKPALPSGGRLEWPVSDRAMHLGYKPNRKQLINIGKTVAKLYRLRHDGENPPEREQFVDGTTRMVKCYGENDLDILDQAIALVMEPPSQLPPAEENFEPDDFPF